MCKSELTPQERSAIIAWNLAIGRTLSTKDVCDLTGLRPSAARKLLRKLARVLPITDDSGTWAAVSQDS